MFSKRDSILRMLGKRYGKDLYPTEDPFKAWEIDSILESGIEMRRVYFKANFEVNPRLREEKLKNFFDKDLPNWFDTIEGKLLSKSPNEAKYIVGDFLTIADLDIAAFGFTHIFNEASPKLS